MSMDSMIRGRRASALGCIFALTALLSGCGGGNDTTPSAPAQVTIPADGATGVPPFPGTILVGAPSANSAVCDGVDLAAFRSRVYVSEDGTDANNCGERTDQACRTLQQAVANCATKGGGCGVVVRHGIYPATQRLQLVDGVSIQASCRFDGEPAKHYRSVMQMAAGVTQGISAIDIKSPTVVQGLVVVGGESPPSNGNIGLYAEASPGLSLQQSVVIAGKGGDGAEPAEPGGQPGGGGGEGTNLPSGSGASGGGGCAADASSPPRSSGSAGGHGGDGMTAGTAYCGPGGCTCTISNLDQIMGGYGLGTLAGLSGGGGGDNGARPGGYCYNPKQGAEFAGRSGAAGRGGACSTTGAGRSNDIWGQFHGGSAWEPSRGGAGSRGDGGSGGGGGSSGGYCLNAQSEVVNGVPAGGGGGGGCGGDGGLGGLQGGYSMALYVYAMGIDKLVPGNAFVPVSGGRGAMGGPGGRGGAGGAGGAGSLGGLRTMVEASGNAVSCPAPSGRGGDGGTGGAGSSGAGGNGGPSIAIGLTGAAVLPAGSEGVYLGPPGDGGDAGPGGRSTVCNGADTEAGTGGAAGRLVNLFALPQNVLAAGQTLAPGEYRTSPNGSYRLILQTDHNLCFYRDGNYQWCSLQKFGVQGASVQMRPDGNLCIYREDGGAVWCAFSAEPAGALAAGTHLAVEDDGTVALRYRTETLRTLP